MAIGGGVGWGGGIMGSPQAGAFYPHTPAHLRPHSSTQPYLSPTSSVLASPQGGAAQPCSSATLAQPSSQLSAALPPGLAGVLAAAAAGGPAALAVRSWLAMSQRQGGGLRCGRQSWMQRRRGGDGGDGAAAWAAAARGGRLASRELVNSAKRWMRRGEQRARGAAGETRAGSRAAPTFAL